KQLDELKARLAAPDVPNDEDDTKVPDTTDSEALKSENAKLKAENEALKTENAQLKSQLNDLQKNQSTQAALNDAKLRFPKVSLNDAKSERDIYVAVLLDSRSFDKTQLKAMSDSDVKTAYI